MEQTSNVYFYGFVMRLTIVDFKIEFTNVNLLRIIMRHAMFVYAS